MSIAPTGFQDWEHDWEDRGAWVGWSLAAAVMLIVHLAAVAGYLELRQPIEDQAAGPIVTVEFAPPTAEPSSQPADIAPVQDTTPPQPVEEPKPQPAPLAEAAPTEPPPPPADTTLEPEPPSQATVTPNLPAPAEETPAPEPPTNQEASPIAVAPAEEPAPPAKPLVVERPKAEPAITAPARPHPKVEHEVRKMPTAKPAAAARPQAARVAALPTNEGVASVGASEGKAAWLGQLRAQLERARRPAAAVQAGIVQLSFTMSRNGRVLSRHILRSSGSPALDQEAMAMVERAQPLPPFPPSMPQAQTSVAVPIRFSPR